jgi:hypothetical protein
MAAVSLTYKLGCREELLEAEQSDHWSYFSLAEISIMLKGLCEHLISFSKGHDVAAHDRHMKSYIKDIVNHGTKRVQQLSC